MTRTTNNFHARLALLFAAVVGALSLFAISTTPTALATTSNASSKISGEAAIALANSGQARLTILLTSNTFLSRIPASTSKLLKTTQGSTAARRDAQNNPTHNSNSESVAASIAESARNAALPAVRRAATVDVEQSDAIRRYIERHGGNVISASPIPNQVTAVVNRELAGLLAAKSAVQSIQVAGAPIEMNAPIDGSSTWWAGGFTGQGASADGNGSPDAVVFDTGVRTTHLAFNSRLPGDLPNADGSGPSRIYSKTGRTDVTGSEHANTIAATIGSTAFYNASGGMAYGIDKLYDDYETFNPYLWNIGVTAGGDPGLGGQSDLPEVINYSAGIYENNVDYNSSWIYFDALEERMGILNTVSAGNCGTQNLVYNGCSTGPYRVSTPANSYNVLTMGGLDTTTTYPDTSGYIPWSYTSPGPTFGGRKKPDLIAPVFGVAGTPSQTSDTTWTAGGYGTSFAAPIGAAGALLLASSGVYLPTAQKAIMINSATPVQGQESWMPKTGWGALNMSTAYSQRGNYANDSIGGNSARFFKVAGVANDDRSTLVWNRRTSGTDITNPGFYDLTNLDLTQYAEGTANVTSTGGSDASDTADSDPTQSTDNPIPGNGSDGGDNVEQIHSTDTGTQILKVKSLSAVDGASNEPFSVASAAPITALEAPALQVSLDSVATSIGGNYNQTTVTATVENPSIDIDLEDVSVELSIPPGLNLPADDPISPVGSLPAGGTATATWVVEGGYSGTKTLSATATGSAYGESFSGSDTTTLDVDMDPPTVSVPAQPLWSTTASPSFQWSGNDALSAVDFYDVEFAIDNGAFVHLLTAQDPGSTTIVAQEGQKVRVRIRATDLFGNVSGWTETSTTIDAIPPVASFGTVDSSKQGIRSVPLFYSNAGSPVTAKFTFANKNGGRTGTALNGEVVSYTNNESKPDFAQLTLVATDALGRRATAQDTYLIEPRLGTSGLKFKGIKRSGKSYVIKGLIAKTFRGKVSVVASRIGSKGTKRVAKKATVKKGVFTAKLKLKPGRYKFVATSPKTSKFSETSISSKLRIK